MKTLAAVLTTLGLVSLAPVALADGVEGARVNPDPAKVRAYWTPERMRAAIPMDVVRPNAKPGGGGGSGGTTTTTGTALQWTWTTPANIAYTNGKVYFKDGTAGYVCSGTVVHSNTGSVVWTAGHCVNDGGNNRFYTDWMFQPAYNSPLKYEWFTASHLYTTSSWANNREFGTDVGAAVVQPQGDTVEGTVGFGRTIRFNAAPKLGDAMDAYGYPAAGKYSGNTLYHCPYNIARFDNSNNPPTIAIPCTMTGGSSGGAWLDTTGAQMSLNSYGYQSLKNTMFGPVFGSAAQAVYNTANQTNPPGTNGTV